MIDPAPDAIDWHAVTVRLEAAIVEHGLEAEPGAREAVAVCKHYASNGGEPHADGAHPRDRALRDFCRSWGLSLDDLFNRQERDGRRRAVGVCVSAAIALLSSLVIGE